jgi:anti-anti-sigma factor
MADPHSRPSRSAPPESAGVAAHPVELVVTLTWLWPEAMVIVLGDVDHFSAPLLGRRLSEAVDAGATRITLDAFGLTFLDAAGMRTLVAASRALRERGGDLVVLDTRPGLTRILTLLGLDRRLTLMEGYR